MSEKWSFLGRMTEAVAACICTFILRIIHGHITQGGCFFSVVLSGIIWLLPGLSLTTSITELATKNLISGFF